MQPVVLEIHSKQKTSRDCRQKPSSDEQFTEISASFSPQVPPLTRQDQISSCLSRLILIILSQQAQCLLAPHNTLYKDKYCSVIGLDPSNYFCKTLIFKVCMLGLALKIDSHSCFVELVHLTFSNLASAVWVKRGRNSK